MCVKFSPEVKAFLLSSPDIFILRNPQVAFVYKLVHTKTNQAYYIGSSRDALARVNDHLCGKCLDSHKFIEAQEDKDFEMHIVDITTEESRLFIEAKHMKFTPGIVNKTKYDRKFFEWFANQEKHLTIESNIEAWRTFISTTKEPKQ